MFDKKEAPTQEIIELIVEQSKSRPIVPFLGAGISASAGFPTIRLIVQYLAKVDFAIRYGIFEDRFPSIRGGQKAVTTYLQHPSRFLEDFGWPDHGQITADLWGWMGQEEDSPTNYGGLGRSRVYIRESELNTKYLGLPESDDKSKIIRDYLYNDIRRIALTEGTNICPNGIYKQSEANPSTLELRDHLRALVQWSLRQEMVERESAAAKGAWNEWLKWKKWYCGVRNDEPALLYGDWEALLDRLAEGNFDLIDGLFTSFEKGLGPTLSHRYLAFLQPKLGIRLILTTNFDSLLEAALRGEGIDPKVFDVHRDAQLPNPSLVNRQLSILKLHGSAYGLRIGERLKYPLEAQARNNALHYIPKDALVIVMGFSGSERRIMQMLQSVVRDRADNSNIRLIWVQGPGKPGSLFSELKEEQGVSMCYIRHIDTFLQELYFTIASSYQSSSKPYPALPGQTETGNREEPHRIITGNNHTREGYRKPVQLFFAHADRKDASASSSLASIAGIRFTQKLEYDYRVIAIDLENHHTVEGVIAEFFDRVRCVDPKAPTCSLTNLDKDGKAIDKVMQRIREVFQRGRYVLVLDSIECFGRAQMVHHGIRSYDQIKETVNLSEKDLFKLNSKLDKLQGDFIRRVEDLHKFLNKLLRLPILVERQYCPVNKKRPIHFCVKKRGSFGFKMIYNRDGLRHDDFYLDSYVVLTISHPRSRYTNFSAIKDNQKTLNSLRESLIDPILAISRDDVSLREHIAINECKEYQHFYPEDLIIESDPSSRLPTHWNHFNSCLSNTNSDLINDSVARAKDVISLLSGLKEPYEHIWFNKEIYQDSLLPLNDSATLGLIALLAIFRRPRPAPLLHSIIERWGLRHNSDEKLAANAHKLIDKTIEALSTKNPKFGIVLQKHEGGTVWLFREIHTNVYDSLTKHLRFRNWNDIWNNYHVVNRIPGKTHTHREVSAIMDGMICIVWHLYAARTYYADMLLPTQDIQAFYEYLYQRVAAIRNITLLISVISKIVKSNKDEYFNTEINKAFSKIYKTDNSTNNPNAIGDTNFLFKYSSDIGLFDPINSPCFSSLSEFKKNLVDLNKHALETLEMALTKNRTLFCVSATPDTMLAWSQQFIERELDDMKGIVLGLSNEENNQETISNLLDYFESLSFEAQISKFNYLTALKSKLDLSDEPSEGILPARIRMKYKEKYKAFLLDCHKIINRQEDNNPEEIISRYAQHIYDDFINIARCLNHLRHPTGSVLVGILEKRLSSKLKSNPYLSNWRKEKYRDIIELKCKILFQKWPIWEPLLERTTSDDRCSKKAPELKQAHDESTRYENTLRATTDTGEKDARHRSSALSLRARSLYLRGHFTQAHHFLDLASAGLHSDRLDHRTSIAVVHITRAELLAISAHEHYFSNSLKDLVPQKYRAESFRLEDCTVDELKEKLVPIVYSSIKKLQRAEQELTKAEISLRGMAQQNLWRVHLEFGCAQVRMELILFTIESLYWNWNNLDEAEYLKQSGLLEQSMLDGLRRLRNILDIIPFYPNEWDDQWDSNPRSDNFEPSKYTIEPSLFKIETNTYKLWRKYFILGAYYSSLLSSLYWKGLAQDIKTSFTRKKQIYKNLPAAVNPDFRKDYYSKQWKLWCSSMRFDNWLGIEITSDDDKFSNIQLNQIESVSLRKVIIDNMKDECKPDKIKLMWNMRRNDHHLHGASKFSTNKP